MRIPDVAASAVAMTMLLPGVARAQAPAQCELVEDVRIGNDNDPDYTLESIRHIRTGPDGSIYATQARAGEILVYDASGRFVRRLGRQGRGPGEFATVTGLGWMGDTLWVTDRVQSRVSFFTREGEVLGTRPLPRELSAASERPPRLEGLLADGSVLALAEPAPYEPSTELLRNTPVLRQRPSADAPDTLAMVRHMPSVLTLRIDGGDRVLPLSVPRNHDRIAVSPDGSSVVVVSGEMRDGVIVAYTVAAVDTNGRRLFRRRFEHAPILLTDEERDRIHAIFADRLVKQFGMRRSAAVRRAADILPVPRSWLAADYVVIGADGRIWLSRRDMRQVMVVLDGRTGEEIAHVRLPNGTYSGTGADAADANAFWMVMQDELRVPSIVRYRIEPAGTCQA